MTPVGLEEDGVNLGKVDGFGAISDGFDHGADAEIFDGTEGAFSATCDEVGRGFCEGCVWKLLRTSLISGRVSKLTPGDFGRISTL